MVSRRRALGGGILGAFAAVFGAGEPAAAAPAAAPAQRDRDRDEGDERIAAAIDKLREEIRTERQFTELGAVRDAQRTYLRINGKFPDYIEVGGDVWFGIHDWHVRWQQPLTVGRDALGRYTIVLNGTAVIMRADALGGYVGIPYDNK